MKRNPKDIDEEFDEPPIRGKVKSRQTKKAKPKSMQSGFIPLDEANAVVTEVYPKLCRVKPLAGGDTYLCNYRRVDVFHRAIGEYRERSPVAVGDFVKFSTLGGTDGVVEGVTERKNQLARHAPGERESMIHVVGANLEGIVIVSSAREPDFVPGVVDRYLLSAFNQNIQTILVVNKIDLLTTGQEEKPWMRYMEQGLVNYLETSAKKAIAIDRLKTRISGGTWLFCGHSGVGKTTLLEALLGRKVGRIGEVNAQTGKGQHTTTSSVLLEAPDGSRWIDTPGVREFAMIGISLEDVRALYPEWKDFECTKAGCLHDDASKPCQAWQSPRHPGYLRIIEEIRERA